MEIIFATNNDHKLHEVSEYLNNTYKIVSLKEIGCFDDIPETADTLEGNALLKARYVHERFGKDCFADDTGLEVEALNNAPGVYSARYAGADKDAGANMRKLLAELSDEPNRKARFRTVIALIKGGKEYLFEGEVRGIILHVAWAQQKRNDALQLYAKSVQLFRQDDDDFYAAFDQDNAQLCESGIVKEEIPLMMDKLRYMV